MTQQEDTRRDQRILRTFDALAKVTVYTLDDVLEQFARDASTANGAAAGAHLGGRRDLAPRFKRLSDQLGRLREAIQAWRSGATPRQFDLVGELREALLLMDELQIELGSREPLYRLSRTAVLRMLTALASDPST